MKYIVMIVLLLGAVVMSMSFQELDREFVEFRDRYDVEGMRKLIDTLEGIPNKDAKLLTLLADALVEYGLWGAEENEKEAIFEKARRYAEEAIKLDPKYARAYFVRGAAIGRLAQYKGILQSLFMVDDYDYSMKKAIELDPKFFRAYVGMGMRYRDLPWPFRSYKKSEWYFLKAIEIEPRYINSYLELGILYQQWKKREKAIEMFRKVLELPPMKGFTAMGMEAKEEAKKRLRDLGAL